MIDALICGRLLGKPVSRTSKSGNPFVTAKLRATDSKGESHFVSVISFNRSACAALVALEDGDSVALAGELSIATYAAKDGTMRPSLDLVAHGVLSEYHVTRKRKALADIKRESASQPAGQATEATPTTAPDFDDEIRF